MVSPGPTLKIITLAAICLMVSSISTGRQRIFTIAIGHDWGAHEYIDEGGYLRGFNKDMIAQVCAAADMKCRTVWDKYTNCWDSQSGRPGRGGVGLLSGWYDACTGYIGTVERIQVFDFSLPFFKPFISYFYIKKGLDFDPTDVTGRRIGFMDGWVSDEMCLARHSDRVKGAVLDPSNIFHYGTTEEALAALRNGEVDAMLQGPGLWDELPDVERVGSFSFTCSPTGFAMMTRKDNDFNSFWNKGLQQLIASGRFSKICKEFGDKHAQKGDTLPCV